MAQFREHMFENAEVKRVLAEQKEPLFKQVHLPCNLPRMQSPCISHACNPTRHLSANIWFGRGTPFAYESFLWPRAPHT